MGIIAGLGRGMPSPRPAGGRGGRWSPAPAGAGAGTWAGTAAHALRRGERVVARTRCAGAGGTRTGLEPAPAPGATPSGHPRSPSRRRGAEPRARPGLPARPGSDLLAARPAWRAGPASVQPWQPAPRRLLDRGLRPRPRPGRRPRRLGGGAAFFAGAFLAAFLATFASAWAARSAPYLSSNRFTTGGSTVELGAFTNSPSSPSMVRTSFNGTSYFLASSSTRTLATSFPPGPNPSGTGLRTAVDVHAHRAVLIARGLIAGS